MKEGRCEGMYGLGRNAMGMPIHDREYTRKPGSRSIERSRTYGLHAPERLACATSGAAMTQWQDT